MPSVRSTGQGAAERTGEVQKRYPGRSKGREQVRAFGALQGVLVACKL